MTLTFSPRKLLTALIGAALLGLCVLAALRVMDQRASAASAAVPVFLAVDPDALLRVFIEERAMDLEGENLARAVRKLDLIVADEALRIHAEYGLPIVKADLLFAGGRDYTDQFVTRVIQQWDLLP